MLKVGAGKACINPTPDMYPLPAPSRSDWGLKPMGEECPYDDMNCRALAIDTGKDKVMFITFELAGCPNLPDLKDQVAEETGFPKENILVIGTHNHTGVKDSPSPYSPPTDAELAMMEKYKEVERAGALSAAKAAVDSMRPAKYAFGEIDSYVNTNRDLKTLGGYWTEARNLAGFSDKTLAIVKFVDDNGDLIAALLNYPCHATCGYLMKDFDHKKKTSGNFNGIACRFVEEHYGKGAVCLWTSGTAGNQNPLLSHGLQYEYSDGWTSSVDYPDGVGFMQMELMGRTHGADAVRGLDAITDYTDKMPVKHVRKSVYLPAQKKVNPQAGMGAFRMGGRGADRSDIPYGQVPPVPSGPEVAPDPDRKIELKMQLLLLGDIAILGMNAEPYCEIGWKMKEYSPFKKTFVITHTEIEKAGYILDETSADHKMFMSFGPVKPGAADPFIYEGEKDLFEEALGD